MAIGSRYSFRRWFQFRLRTLLALLLFVGVVLGLLEQRRVYLAQEESIKLLAGERNYWKAVQLREVLNPHAAKGSIADPFGDCDTEPLMVQIKGVRDVEALREYLNLLKESRHVLRPAGNEWVQLGEINVLERAIPDWPKEIDSAHGLEKLTTLSLNYPTASGIDLEPFRGCTAIKNLGLSGTAFSDDDIARLTEFPQIECLDLARTKVTGRTLEQLAACTQLNVLALDGCNISNEGMRAIGNLSSLVYISLDRAQVNDAAFRQALWEHPNNRFTQPRALESAMRWIAGQQREGDGAWCMRDPFDELAAPKEYDDPLVTGAALLALSVTGRSHVCGIYKRQMDKGFACLQREYPDGRFVDERTPGDRLFTQSICTLSLVEAWAITHDKKLRAHTESAVAECAKMLAERWPAAEAARPKAIDLGTGWAVQALLEARAAKLSVDTAPLLRIKNWLEEERKSAAVESPPATEWAQAARTLNVRRMLTGPLTTTRWQREADALFAAARRAGQLTTAGTPPEANDPFRCAEAEL